MRLTSSASENARGNLKRILSVMSFILKSPRLATGLVGFSRHAKFPFRKRKIFPSTLQHSFRVNQTFVRYCALAPENKTSQNSQQNFKEILYQKSISQVYLDIKLKGYTFRTDFNDAWYTLKSSRDFTAEQIELLIKSCGHSLPLEPASEKLKLVKELWDSFDDLGIKKTINHYHALLDVYNELEHNFSPKDFLGNLENQGVPPNSQTYKKLIRALSIQGEISKAQSLLEHMKKGSVNIDDGVFNSLILGYSLQGDFISARGILELMKEKGLTMSSESYLSLALGYAKRGDIDEVKQIMDERTREAKFSATDFLEIVYTFAVNNHSEHVPTILDMITLKKNFPTVSVKVVHRLLHRNLDKEALMVLELRDKLESINMVQEPIQMFLDHYVRFRKPIEVLNLTETYKKRGWSPIALAYCIKETLIRKDIPYCLDFLSTLKTQGYPLRVHYFYPILIKSHQFGNEKVVQILQHMTKNNVTLGREAAKSFNIFYDFIPGAEFDDLAKLKKAGVREQMVAWKILNILLNRENINTAAELVSTCGIAYPAVFLPVSMAFAFSKHQSEPEKFVYILYHLIHNLKVNKIKRHMDSRIDPVEYEQFSVEIAKTCEKTFNLRVMEEMLKKKIPLSLDAGSCMLLSCPEASDLISKLTSADLEMEFDESLLNRLLKIEEPKIRKNYSEKKGKGNDWSQLDEALEKHEKVPVVMDIFENLTLQTGFSKNTNCRNIVKRLITYVSTKGDVANTERIYRIGIEEGLIRPENYNSCVTAYLVSGDVEDAVKRYYEGLKATKKSNILEPLLREIKRKENFLLLNDLNASISNVFDEKFAATQLLVKFAKLKFRREMRIILDSETELSNPLFNTLCQTVFREKDVNCLEVLETVSRNTTKLNLNSVYYKLLKLYTFQGNLEKILKLYVFLERDDSMKEDVRKLFLQCLKNWPHYVPERLQNVSQCIMEDCQAEKPLKGLETVSHEENIQNGRAKKGKQSIYDKNEVISNLDNKNILKCFCLIQAGKLDKYFTILREISSEGPLKAKSYFFCYKLVPHMTTKQKYLNEYEQLVAMCDSIVLWKKYFKLCVRLGHVKGVRRALSKVKPNQLTFFLKDVSIEDCLQVIEKVNDHTQMGGIIAAFYAEVISRCKDKNKLKMIKMYYEKAKKYKLDNLIRTSDVLVEN